MSLTGPGPGGKVGGEETARGLSAPQNDVEVTASPTLDAPPPGGGEPAQRLWRVLLLAGLVLAADGYDSQAIGYVAPALVETWSVPRPMLGPVFSAGILGMMLGAMTLSVLADRNGGRRLLLACCGAFGLLTLACGFAPNFPVLIVLRFLTGLALGGAAPIAVGLVAEYAPARIRTTVLTLAISGFSLGGALGGVVAGALIEDFGWRSIFIVGGLAPILLLPALALWLPRTFHGARPAQPKSPVRNLFLPGVAGPTLLMWLIYFLNLLVLYTLSNWLPTLIHADGQSIATASIATTGYQLAGTAGGLAIARLCDLLQPTRVLACSFVAAGIAVWLLSVAGGGPVAIFAAAAAAGFFVVGGQNAFSAFVGGYYPSGLRATGTGWAQGVGRFGSVLGPLLAGGLFVLGATPATVFKLCAGPAAIAAVSILLVGAIRPRTGLRASA